MSNVTWIDAKVLFQPAEAELQFLPEGPQWCGGTRLSWVAIQHGANASIGSLNLLDLRSGENWMVPLRGRPGFAFPTADEQIFVIGLEHELCLVDLASGNYRPLGPPVETEVNGTIINDGEFFADGIVFGAKDLQFAEAKAGLYLYRRADAETICLGNNYICSNGKVILPEGAGTYRLLDIDSPRKRVDQYRLDVMQGTLEHVDVALDFSEGSVFPDGMVATPDGRGVIIAFYNPHDADYGEARLYDLESRQVTTIWRTPGSPQVTCPQLVEVDGRIQLVLTTAVEHMSRERQRRYPLAGCLFIADTPFDGALPRRVCRV
jgi:sugar lactone lactonase YvrE